MIHPVKPNCAHLVSSDTVFMETGEFRYPKKGEWMVECDGSEVIAEKDFTSLKCHILIPTKATIHAPIKPAKPPKPDPLAQAIAEAKERLAGLEALRQAAQEHANRKGDVKLLAAREKELRVKWLPEKPKAAKAGRKGK